MRLSLPLALATATMITAAGTALSAEYAAADIDCTPVIQQSSLTFTATPAALGSKGSTTITVAANVTAPCGSPDGADLDVTAILSPVDVEHDVSWNVSSELMPAGGSSYHLASTVTLKAAQINNVDAGTFDAYLGVVDTDDPGEYGLTSYSDPVPVSLRRAATVTANAAPEPVKKGKTIKVKGALSRANWDSGHDAAYGKQPVRLQFRTKAGAYQTVQTVHSSAGGAVSAKVKAGHDGYYRFVFAGNASTAPATSAGDYVNVT